MFEDSLVESAGKLAARSPWSTVASFTLQAALLSAVLLLSLIYTETLPVQHGSNVLQLPPPPTASAPTARATLPAGAPSGNSEDAFTVPRETPKHVDMRSDTNDTNTGVVRAGTDIAGAIPADATSRISDLLRRATGAAPKLAQQSKVRVSGGVAEGLLIYKVKPEYPPLAMQARIEGRVVLHAVIAKDGAVQGLRLVSGHPLLVQAAMNAVQQWRYRPYLLNGEPVEVDTTINVDFTLGP